VSGLSGLAPSPDVTAKRCFFKPIKAKHYGEHLDRTLKSMGLRSFYDPQETQE
jgi:hypothetical protein